MIVFSTICAVGGYVRLHDLSEWSLSSDDLQHLDVAACSWREEYCPWAGSISHPKLYHYFLGRCLSLFGSQSALGLRSISLGSGVMSIAAAYALGRTVTGGPWLGLLGAYLVATSPILIEQSGTLRNYSLLIMLLLWLYVVIVREPLTPRRAAMSFVLMTAACMTHHSAALVIPAFLLAVLPGTFHREKHCRPVVAAWFLANLGLIVLVSQMAARFSYHTNSFFERLYAHAGGSLAGIGSVAVAMFKDFYGTAGACVLLPLFLPGLFLLARNQQWSWLIVAVVPYVTAIGASLMKVYPWTPGRHAIFLFPATLVPILFFFSALSQRAWGRFVLSFLVSMSLISQFVPAWSVFPAGTRRKKPDEFGLKLSEVDAVSAAFQSGRFTDRVLLVDEESFGAFDRASRVRGSWSLVLPREQRILPLRGLWALSDPQSQLCPSLTTLRQSAQGPLAAYVIISGRPLLSGKSEVLEGIPGCFTVDKEERISESFLVVGVRVP